MSRLRACIVFLGIFVACGGAKRPDALSSKSSWTAPAILHHVPADTPYLFAVLESNERLRRRMIAGVDQQLEQALKTTEAIAQDDRAQLEPWLRGVLAVLDELRGKPAAEWSSWLGFGPDSRYVVYGVSVWPVLRVEISDPVRLRGVIDRALRSAAITPRRQTLAGRPYLTLTMGRFELILAVLDRELVVSIVPPAVVSSMLPLVLGIARPASSLATTNTIPELVGRHGLTHAALAYVDSRALARLVTGAPTAFEAPIRAATGPITPECRGDTDRLAAFVPRIVFGYRRLDESGFDMTIVAETPPAITNGLAKLRTEIPGVTPRIQGKPLFALGAAVSADALLTWLRGVARQLAERPFRCDWLRGLNELGPAISSLTDRSMPEVIRTLQGFALRIDQLEMLPPTLVADVLLVGDRVYDIVPLLNQSMPVFGGVPLAADGRPTEIPTANLGVPGIDSAHLATKGDRLAIAVGAESARRSSLRLATAAPARSPLVTCALDAPRLQKLLERLGSSTDTSRLRELGDVVMRLDVTDAGVAFDMTGTWGPTD